MNKFIADGDSVSSIRLKICNALRELERVPGALSGAFANPGCVNDSLQINHVDIEDPSDPRYLPIRNFVKSIHRFYKTHPLYRQAHEALLKNWQKPLAGMSCMSALYNVELFEDAIYEFLLGLSEKVDLTMVESTLREILADEEFVKLITYVAKPAAYSVNVIASSSLNATELLSSLKFVARQGFARIYATDVISVAMLESLTLTPVIPVKELDSALPTVQLCKVAGEIDVSFSNSLNYLADQNQFYQTDSCTILN